MQTVLIVGGGAAGMTAAITASRLGHRVILAEKQPRVGKKLLATGNGCCNLTNTRLTPDCYFGTEPDFASFALSRFGLKETLDFFSSLGLLTRTEENGRVYPNSMQAGSVLDLLRFALNAPNIELKCGTAVLSARKKGGGFEAETSAGKINADKLIICCGGAAAPKLGGCTDGYELLKSLGHSRTSLYPSLVQIKTDNTYPRALKGIKSDMRVTLLCGGRALCGSFGEVLFTEYGLSGPAIFEISRYAATEKNLIISLDLMPEHDEKEVARLLSERRKSAGSLTCEDFMTGLLNKRLGQTALKYAGLTLSVTCASLTDKNIAAIARAVKDFRLPVTGTTGFENAQVTAGGIKTGEFSPKTLESRLVPGLFAAGEVLDIDGRCGGYNLQWAWSSGMLAGRLGEL